MRILIAERDPHGRRFLEHTLRMEGHEVFISEFGRRFKDLVARSRPDMILMNVFHCLRSGADSLKQIKVRCNSGPEPVVLVSCTGLGSPDPGECETDGSTSAFDRLPTTLKICILEKIQGLCTALEHFKRWSQRKTAFSSRRSFSLDELDLLPLRGPLWGHS